MARHDELLAQAVAETGLDDFGDDSFREGLALLVADLGRAGLNAAGEGYLYPRIVGYLSQRLQVEDWYRRHPEIDDEQVVAPLIGLSLPRTGSTALSFLLAQDPAIRYLHMWESATPCPPPSTVVGPDPRIPSGWGQGQGQKIGTRDHVPADIDGPFECLDLLALDFKSQMFLAFAQIPEYFAWLLEADLSSAYRYELRVLKLLQWGQPTRPWRLKTPMHMLYLRALDEVFPDARFVMTHRDPTDVLLSVCDVYADIGATFSDHLDKHLIGEQNVRQWSLATERALAFRLDGNDDRFYDIDFRAMQQDPIGEVRGLYAWLGEPVSDEFESRMQQWWTANAANREPSPARDPADFGLDLDAIRPRFADWVAHSHRWTAHHQTTS
jgi:hypothetical protein